MWCYSRWREKGRKEIDFIIGNLHQLLNNQVVYHLGFLTYKQQKPILANSDKYTHTHTHAQIGWGNCSLLPHQTKKSRSNVLALFDLQVHMLSIVSDFSPASCSALIFDVFVIRVQIVTKMLPETLALYQIRFSLLKSISNILERTLNFTNLLLS